MVRKLNLEDKDEIVRTEYQPYVSNQPVEDARDKSGFWDKIFNKNKFKGKPQRIAVIYKRLNGTAEPLLVDCDNKGMFQINKRTYHMRKDCKYLLGKDRIPFCSVREEGLYPDGNADFYKGLEKIEAVEVRCAEMQDSSIKAIRHAELVKIAGEDKKPFNKTIIVFIIIGIIGFALLKNYV